jgi:hypothetical protein
MTAMSVLRLVVIAMAMGCAARVGPAFAGQATPPDATRPQEPVPPLAPIQPDRPDVTNGTAIVEVGLLQVEAGVQHARLGSNQQAFGTPVGVRVGIYEWLEARVSTDGFLRQSDASSSVIGVGNVQVGAKLRLFSDPGGAPVLSILPSVNLPVASAVKGLGSGDSDVTVALLTGADFGRSSHIDVNYGVGALGAGQGQPHFAEQLVSVSLSHSLTEQFSPYIEAFWFSRQDPNGRGLGSVDAGFIHAFTARFAVDGGLAFGLTNAAPTLMAFGGVSIIVGDVLGDHGVIARQRKAARLHGRTSR